MYWLLGVAVMPKTANINKMHSINILLGIYWSSIVIILSS